jgi:hypothetical protein
LTAQVLAHPDAILAEHRAMWADASGIHVSVSTMGCWVRSLGITRKKTLIAREQDPRARAAYRTEMAQVDPATLVFVDETSTPTTLTRVYARAPRGQRAVGRVPRGRRTAVLLLATLTPDGLGA